MKRFSAALIAVGVPALTLAVVGNRFSSHILCDSCFVEDVAVLALSVIALLEIAASLSVLSRVFRRTEPFFSPLATRVFAVCVALTLVTITVAWL